MSLSTYSHCEHIETFPLIWDRFSNSGATLDFATADTSVFARRGWERYMEWYYTPQEIQSVWQDFGTDSFASGSTAWYIWDYGTFHKYESAQDYLLEEYDFLQNIRNALCVSRAIELYSLCNMEAVCIFLCEHSELAAVVVEGYDYIRELFGSTSEVILEVVNDPESKDQEQLFIYILTDLTVDDALVKLDRLDQEWFLGQVDRVGGFLNINLEFV